MHGAASGLECVLEAIDLVLQPIALSPHLVPLAAEMIQLALGVGALPIPLRLFAAQPFNLSLLPLKLGDQVVARSGVPSRSHALVMPRFDQEYKQKLRRSRRSDVESEVTTR